MAFLRDKVLKFSIKTVFLLQYYIKSRGLAISHNKDDQLSQISLKSALQLMEPSNPKKQSIKTYKIVIFFMILFLSLMVGSYMAKNRADHVQVNITAIVMHVSVFF